MPEAAGFERQCLLEIRFSSGPIVGHRGTSGCAKSEIDQRPWRGSCTSTAYVQRAETGRTRPRPGPRFATRTSAETLSGNRPDHVVSSACHHKVEAAMIEQLTKNERQLAIVILLVLTACGITLAGVGQGDPLGRAWLPDHGGRHWRHLLGDLGLLRARTGGGSFRQLLRRSEQGRHPHRHGAGRRSACSSATGWPGCSPIRTSPSTPAGRASAGCGPCTPPASSSASAAMR